MSIELLGSVTPILMLGESHSLAFRDLLFKPEWADDTFMCRTVFLPQLVASEYSVGHAISPHLAGALQNEGILDAGLRPSFFFMDASAAFISGKPVIAPPIVFFGGDTNLVYLIDKLGTTWDFELPDDPGYGADRSKQPIPFATIDAEVAKIVGPMVNAIAMLRNSQFSRLMVHCIPPRNPDDAMAAVFTGAVEIPASVRAKVAVLMNRRLKAACDAAGIPFIDIWPDTTEQGFLRREFVLDGIHLNRKAALVSLAKVAEVLYDRTAGTTNAMRYTALHAQAARTAAGADEPQSSGVTSAGADAARTSIVTSAGADAARTSTVTPAGADTDRTSTVTPAQAGAQGTASASIAAAETWNAAGYAATRVDCAGFAAQLAYRDADSHPLARVDWTGWPRTGRPGVQLADLDPDSIAAAHALLASALDTLQAGSDRALTAISVRPVRTARGTMASPLLAQALPVGARRALLQLSEGGEVAYFSASGEPLAMPLSGQGTLVAYDPARVQVRVAGADVAEIVLIPRLPDQPFRVVAAGLCEWPADPYQFSVQGMPSHPPFSTPTFAARAERL